MNVRVGAKVVVESNNGQREATILATRRTPGSTGYDAVVEYVMPGGSSALRFVHLNASGDVTGGRKVSYHDLPMAWLSRIVDGGVEWVGKPQQGEPVGTPRQFKADRARACPTCGRKGYKA